MPVRHQRTIARTRLALALLGSALLAAGAQAAPITDAANDFIPTFTGTHNGDLDVISTSAVYDGAFFHLSATMNAPIGTSPDWRYVWGFNRGQGTARFGAIATGVLFDSVVLVTTGVAGATVNRLIEASAVTLPAAAVSIAGATITVDVPVSLLPSLGLDPADYGINIWPRVISGVAGNSQISDFAPDNATFAASVPEPASLALLSGAIGLAGVVRRRRARG